MKTEVSSLCSQESAAGPYCEPDDSTHTVTGRISEPHKEGLQHICRKEFSSRHRCQSVTGRYE
jgi:hypothetical protein